MALVVNTNISSITAQRNLAVNNSSLAKSLERLSSGLRVNRAADDAAGLAIANKLNFQARGQNQAIRNAGDAISLVQTAEGAFQVATNIVGRLRELAVQAASDTNTSSDRLQLKAEADLLVQELTRVARTTEFNGATLLDGTFTAGKIQVGANAEQTLSFTLGNLQASQLGKFAQFSADITDGLAAGVFSTGGAGNLTTGEFTINGQLVGATNTTDDQVSVLTLNTAAAAVSGAADGSAIASAFINGGAGLYINGTLITNTTTGSAGSYSQASEFVVALVAKINQAGITNVTARTNAAADRIIIEATKGTDVALAFSGAAGTGEASVASALGLDATFFGSGASGNATSNYNGQSSAIAKAAAINSVRSKSNVTASAQATTVTLSGAVGAGSLSANSLYINSVAIDAVTGITASDGTGALRAAINAKSSSTGVTASVDNFGKLVLSAADGRNIALYVDAGATTVTGESAGAKAYRSSIKFVSNDAVVFTGTTTDVGALNTNTAYQPDLNNSVALLDITTQTGATTAINSLDAALAQINLSRSQVGALQSRLELTVQSLQVSAENQTAAESRIRDADYAFETAVFTRNQILVQAGTAILAQANTSPQIALQLLQR